MSNPSFEEFAEEFARDLAIKNHEFQSCDLRDLKEYDSMGMITVSLTIERLFGFEIAFEDLEKLSTLTALYKYCEDFGTENLRV